MRFIFLWSFITLLIMAPISNPGILPSPKPQPIAIVIHGGAGSMTPENIPPGKQEEYKAMLSKALSAGYEILGRGGTSLDAVEAAIVIMENSPLFNAGKGAVFTKEGRNELDASIMDGKNLMAGAVAGVTVIKNPIKAARAVMEKSQHVMMAGAGAEQFAKQQGLEIVEPEYFFLKSRYDDLQKIKEEERQKELDEGSLQVLEFDKLGTVGCVALDRNGNIAAGTSTGGMTNKRFGRIGDSPIIGAGTYADNATAGISCTGHGEYFIRNAVAYDITARMKYKRESLAKAAQDVIMEKLKGMGGSGGVIGLDQKGNVVIVFNTSGMFRGFKKEGEEAVVKIFE